jgi:predicted DCC family thiol-disulfide oxidoreductase YuxK
MKPANKIILYDDACPMCSTYTKAFVQTGLIDPSGRKSFSAVSPELLGEIDPHRCRNEIPLIDTAAHTVKYGIDALLEILSARWPLVKTIGSLKPINWFLKKLYNLVSFNRRVITASSFKEGNFDCTPDFNIKYRLLFLLLGLSFNTIMLIPEHSSILLNSILDRGSLAELQTAHFIFVLVNIGIAWTIKGREGLEFLGQANMLALLTTLLLLPMILANYLVDIPATLNNSYLLALLVFIASEYKRRMVYAKIIPANTTVAVLNIFSALCFLLYLSL